MCGIAGAVALTPDARPDREIVARMSCRLEHRGPDGHGLWVAPSGRACLAHRRLSIIDLATGQQPMISADGTLGIVFNGEMYNYRERRAELEADGETFATTSDTEVLMRLLERRWTRALPGLRGMFAFAAWDDRSGRFIAVRDRLGKKPFFHAEHGGCLYFASSLKALRESLPGTWPLDAEAVDAFLTLGYIPAPTTIYRNVAKLRAGTALLAENRALRTERYWSLARAEEPFAGSFGQAADRLDELLNEAVALRLRSDVPLGVFLSGGIDSSLVAAVAARQSPTQVRTFSIGMDVAAFDESSHAAEVARRLGTAHQLFRAQPDLLGLLPKIVWHYGEPYADSSALPSWLLARRAREHVTVALGGDGGDEGFAGYPWYQTALRLRRVSRSIPQGAFAAAGRALDGVAAGALTRWRGVGRVRRGLAALAIPEGGQRFAALRSVLSEAEARALYSPALLAQRGPGLGATGRRLAALYDECEGSDLRRMRYVDVETYLADCLLPKVDVATMASSLELRAPLLDQEVVRFALSLPDEYVLSGRTDKRLLRAVLGRYLPAELFDRPKQGFSLPLSEWFRGELRPLAEGLSRSERLGDTGWVRPEGIARLVREHVEARRDHSQRIFGLLALDEWLKGA